MFHMHPVHRCLPGGLPAILQRDEAIAAMRPDAETSRRRCGPGQICALPASIAAPAGARTVPPVQSVSLSDSIKPTLSRSPASLDKTTNTLYAERMRHLHLKTDKLVEGTFRVSASQ